VATVVRTARPADLPVLARLCRAAVGSHDYVLGYLPEMVAAREARVVEQDGRVVALTGITECADGALWLGQLRTDPRFRRRGFATLLLDDAFERVVREGRPALRLWTSRRNAAAQVLFARDGFRRVAGFTRMAAPAGGRRAGGRRGRRAPVAGAGETVRPAVLWTWWRRSRVCRSGKGYLDYRWHFLPLSPSVLGKMIQRGEVFASTGVAVVAWCEKGDAAAYGAVLAGAETAFLQLRRLAATMGRARVEVFLPDSRPLVRAARAAGYGPADWGRAAILFERRNLKRRTPRGSR
jgi:ribosomal protein S18 acetylase RimI-like enzyme